MLSPIDRPGIHVIRLRYENKSPSVFLRFGVVRGSIATSGLPHANGESVRSAIDTIGKAGGVGDATILTMGREDVLRATIVDCRKFKNDAGLI